MSECILVIKPIIILFDMVPRMPHLIDYKLHLISIKSPVVNGGRKSLKGEDEKEHCQRAILRGFYRAVDGGKGARWQNVLNNIDTFADSVGKNIDNVADQCYHATQYSFLPPVWPDHHPDFPLLASKM